MKHWCSFVPNALPALLAVLPAVSCAGMEDDPGVGPTGRATAALGNGDAGAGDAEADSPTKPTCGMVVSNDWPKMQDELTKLIAELITSRRRSALNGTVAGWCNNFWSTFGPYEGCITQQEIVQSRFAARFPDWTFSLKRLWNHSLTSATPNPSRCTPNGHTYRVELDSWRGTAILFRDGKRLQAYNYDDVPPCEDCSPPPPSPSADAGSPD